MSPSAPSPELSFNDFDRIFICRFRPFLNGELDNDLDKRQQTSVVFHKKGKNVMLKVSQFTFLQHQELHLTNIITSHLKKREPQ